MDVAPILTLTILFQFVAAILALRLIPTTGKGPAWRLVSVGMILLALHHCLKLYRLASGERFYMPTPFTEGLSLLVSMFLMTGILLISPLFFAMKDSAKALKKSEERYKQLIETMNDGFGVQDTHGVFTYVNERLSRMLGHPREEIVGYPVVSFMDQENGDLMKRCMSTVMEGGRFSYEVEWTAKDGSRVSTIISPNPLVDENNALIGAFAVVTDITDRKRAEESVRESEERLRALIDAMPDFVCFRDGEGRWLVVNETGLRLFQLEGIDYKGKKGGEISELSPAYSGVYPTCKKTDEVTWNEGAPWRGEEVVSSTNGCDCVYSMTKVPLFHKDGKRKGLVVLGRDVTENKRAQEILIHKTEEQTLLLDNIETQIWYLKSPETYGAVNRAHAAFLGMEKEDLEGKSLFEVVPRQEATNRSAANKRVFERKEKLHAEESFLDGSGGEHLLSVVRTPKLDEEGDVEYVICAAYDITEAKKAERRVRESLKEKDILLKEIHHRVKNNLQIISSLLNLQSQYVQNRDIMESLRDSRNRIKSIALVHEKLYQSKDLANVRFSEYVANLLRYLFRSYGISPELVRSAIDIDDVSMGIDTIISCGLIINELVSNSLKHAFSPGEGGEIGIRFRSNQSFSTLEISDNGVGLPEELDIEGTESLGLKLVVALVDELKGRLELHSEKGLKIRIVWENKEKGHTHV
jgi:hypothetical protein